MEKLCLQVRGQRDSSSTPLIFSRTFSHFLINGILHSATSWPHYNFYYVLSANFATKPMIHAEIGKVSNTNRLFRSSAMMKKIHIHIHTHGPTRRQHTSINAQVTLKRNFSLDFYFRKFCDNFYGLTALITFSWSSIMLSIHRRYLPFSKLWRRFI